MDDSLESLVGEIPMTTEADEQAARQERAGKKSEAKAKPIAENDSDSEDEIDELADDADESDDPDAEESSDEPEDQDDPENTVLVVTVNGEELELPSNTPKPAIEAIKKMEKDLYSGFQRKTQEIAEQRRQQESVIEQAKAESLEAQKVEIQKAQARVQAIAQAAYTPEETLLELADVDRETYKHRVKLNSQINQQWNALNAHFEQVDADIKSQKQKAIQARAKVAWQRLGEEKLSEGDVQKIIQDGVKAYGLPNDYVESLADAEQVLMMRDALEYRKIKEQSPQVRKRIAKSDKAGPRNATRAQPQRNKQREQRFSKGTASIDDLADFLMTSQGQ